MNLAPYYPVFLFLVVGLGLGIALVSIGKILGPNKPDTEKMRRMNAASRHSKTRV